MSTRFILPLADVGSGIKPSDGAKLFFSENGLPFSTNPKNTFTDNTDATPNANPVIADSKGVFPDIYITGSNRAVLKDKNDVQIWQADDLVERTIPKTSDLIIYTPAGTGAVATTVQEKLREVVSVLDFADNRANALTGAEDINVAVRRACASFNGSPGAVYFPSGNYIWGISVNIPTGIKLFGNGRASIIKKPDGTSAQNPIIIATYDYENSDTSTFISNKEDIEITGLAFDFNFNAGWQQFYVPILLRGSDTGNSEFIQNIKIHDNYWFDSNGAVTHSGGDSWCINLSGAVPGYVRDVAIYDNVSRAENHQFVAGGAAGQLSISVINNKIFKPRANGIFISGFVNAAGLDNLFRDIQIKDNVIYDSNSVGIAVGPDAGQISSDGMMKGVTITGNQIRFVSASSGTVIGILARAYGELNEDLLIAQNTIVNESAASMVAVDVDAFDAGIANGTTNGAFVQPSPDNFVTVNYDSPDAAWVTATSYTSNDHVVESGLRYRAVASHTSGVFATDLADKKWVRNNLYSNGSLLRIGKTATERGGVYEVTTNTTATQITVKLKDWFNFSAAAASIPDESTIIFIGGYWKSGKVSNNVIRNGSIDVSVVDNFSVTDNQFSRETDDFIRCNTYNHDMVVDNNTAQFIRVSADFDGSILGNKFINSTKANLIDLQSTTDALGYNFFVDADIAFNQSKVTKTNNDVVAALKLSGNADIVVRSRFNNYGPSTARGIDRGSVPKTNIKSYGDTYTDADVDGFPFGYDSSIFGSQSLDFNLTSVASENLTMTVEGAATGDFVQLQPPAGVMDVGIIYTAWVSATDTVTVRAVRGDGSTPNPSAGVFKVMITKSM